MDINFSNIRNSFENFNFNDSALGKFVNENKKTIQLVALSTLSVGTAYAAYQFMVPSAAEEACHEVLKNGVRNLPGLTRNEYEILSATIDDEALTDKTKAYLTCVAKMTENVVNPTLKPHKETNYNLFFEANIKNEALLAEKTFKTKIEFKA